MAEIVSIDCPYCWQLVTLEVEELDGSGQFVEDCSVCCQPIVIQVKFRGGNVEVSARREND